ncbi:MAG: 2-amino-4-hydroxy-6-hydroxymethyldihydropteridine diphosphokinase [Pseudomonadota bacterium]|nr:2-amino-4-hydroxy-6-hydroxymethyldihydropteridine diphosphokinase [Pseudomonadota bacterium]
MAQVYVGIGSNVEPARHVPAAVAALRAAFGPLHVSPVYRSRAVGFAGDEFWNLAVGFATGQNPHAVAARLRAIEAAHGRRRDLPRLSSRTLDLDLLLYDDLVLEDPSLRLPRDDILRHAFVLRPLADLAGQRRHPLLNRTLAALWAAFDQDAEPLHPVDLALERL